jgi:hypothetical protein
MIIKKIHLIDDEKCGNREAYNEKKAEDKSG